MRVVLSRSCLIPRVMGTHWQTSPLSDGNGGYSRKADPRPTCLRHDDEQRLSTRWDTFPMALQGQDLPGWRLAGRDSCLRTSWADRRSRSSDSFLKEMFGQTPAAKL
ncbi:hypothetical protein M405DRAFT_98606 [Rhizopogon salebrosus TDB-379]|nr:hypothetical protein M405DRAFT_98606 [Rhizopogon salebrosus TDB-379]